MNTPKKRKYTKSYADELEKEYWGKDWGSGIVGK